MKFSIINILIGTLFIASIFVMIYCHYKCTKNLTNDAKLNKKIFLGFDDGIYNKSQLNEVGKKYYDGFILGGSLFSIATLIVLLKYMFKIF